MPTIITEPEVARAETRCLAVWFEDEEGEPSCFVFPGDTDQAEFESDIGFGTPTKIEMISGELAAQIVAEQKKGRQVFRDFVGKAPN